LFFNAAWPYVRKNLDHNQLKHCQNQIAFFIMLVQMQFRNCTEIRLLFLTLNYIKYLKDKLFWVSILDNLALGIPSYFLNDRTKLWRAFLDAGKSTFHLAVTNKRVWKTPNHQGISPICDKLWILSVW